MFQAESKRTLDAIRKEIDSIQNEIDDILGKHIIAKRYTKKPYNLLIGVQNGRRRR